MIVLLITEPGLFPSTYSPWCTFMSFSTSYFLWRVLSSLTQASLSEIISPSPMHQLDLPQLLSCLISPVQHHFLAIRTSAGWFEFGMLFLKLIFHCLTLQLNPNYKRFSGTIFFLVSILLHLVLFMLFALVISVANFQSKFVLII